METVAMIAFPTIVLLLGMLGSIVSAKNIPNWYQKLVKPSFNPPNWIFGPMWTLLYLMVGYSGYLIWSEDKAFTSKHTYAWLAYFMGLALNYAWTPIFFGLHMLFTALVVILMMVFVTVINIFLFYNVNTSAGLILIPYLLWIGFASILNFFIWRLNRDGERHKLMK